MRDFARFTADGLSLLVSGLTVELTAESITRVIADALKYLPS